MTDLTLVPRATPADGGQTPRQFGRYAVAGLIGEGAMGRVYRAFDPLANRAVAIKTIKRDIKTANIMILPDGRPKLMDFGVARLEDSASSGTGQIVGSPYYMAPEQMSGDIAVTARADTYSLAVVTYEALTGQRPFQA